MELSDKSKDVCYVYWIRLPEHTDMTKEGYIGITCNVPHRFKQHCSNAKNSRRNTKEMRQNLREGKAFVETLVCSSKEYCLELERKLRPNINIGWNKAMGADGGYLYKHGLTGSRIAKTYYNLLTRAKTEDEFFYPDWFGSDGIVRFQKYYESMLKISGEFTLIEKGQGYTPFNLTKISRSEMMIKINKRYDIGDGMLYSAKELGLKFNMKPNTISVRVLDGWTIREAVGLDYRKPKRKPNVKK